MGRSAADHLTTLVASVEANPSSWEFFALVRAFEQVRSDLPRLGTAVTPDRDALSLAHEPSAGFPRTTVTAFSTEGRRPKVNSAFLGLTGPMGPLPFHFTEVAIFERAARAPSPFADFLDLISARMLQAFYRAWGNAQPCVQADRPHDDKFAAMLGAVSGAVDLRFVTAAERPAKRDEGFDDWRRLTYAGHFASLRSTSAISDYVSHLIRRDVTVSECVGRWRHIPRGEQTRLGGSARDGACLGSGATVGSRFHSVEWDVAIAIKVGSMAELVDLAPGGDQHALLSEAIQAILPAHLEWEARIEILEPEIAGARLGATRLGYTSWVAPRGNDRWRSDLRVQGKLRHAA